MTSAAAAAAGKSIIPQNEAVFNAGENIDPSFVRLDFPWPPLYNKGDNTRYREDTLMTAALDNILMLADRDLAAGRYADAEAEYAKALETDAELYVAVHGRGVARTWQSNLLSGDPVALLNSTDDALRMCRRALGDEEAFLQRVAVDLINLTSTKYNELTRIYVSISRRENQTAPSPLFFYTWSLGHPQGLSLQDIYIPMINYLAAVIRISEYLDGLLKDRPAFARRRLQNALNLGIFYDWLIAFNATGRVSSDYYMEITAKKRSLAALRKQLEAECAEPEYRNVPYEAPEGRPLPGIAAEADREAKVARFGKRPPFDVICPLCGTVQNADRSICYHCSCKFVFDDETE